MLEKKIAMTIEYDVLQTRRNVHIHTNHSELLLIYPFHVRLIVLLRIWSLLHASGRASEFS